MPGLQIRRVPSGNLLRLQLSGVLDRDTARDLCAFIEGLPLHPLSFDFSSVTTYADLAIAMLAPAFLVRQVELCGLPLHQERMFRYFGVTAQAHPPVGEAEERLAG